MKCKKSALRGAAFAALAFLCSPQIGILHIPSSYAEQSVAAPNRLKKLESSFKEAEALIEKKAFGRAADEIRKAADLIEKEAQTATAEEKALLSRAGKELADLAVRMETVPAEAAWDSREVFARAYSAVAEYYETKSSQSWARNAISETGEYLRKAADNLELAWVWSGRRIETGTDSAIRYAKATGQKMSRETKAVSGEFDKAIQDLKTEIGRLRTRLSGETEISLKIIPLQLPGAAIGREDLSTAITRTAEAAIPAVVQIQVTERREVLNPFLPFEGSPYWRHFFNLPKKMPKKFKEELMGLGTGMILDAQGHILTNNHVVGGATEMTVFLANGDEYPAQLVGTDPKTDLAVIKVSSDRPLPHVRFGDSDQVAVGQWVVAIGQPRGLDQTVTQGIISAKHRAGITNPNSYQDFLQTDAAINPGNSGGPLLTLEGLVIGVNSAIATQSGGFEGIGFAIPSRMAVPIAEALIAHGKVERGWLGVSTEDLTPAKAKSAGLAARKGALVAKVMHDGPADKGGLKAGDVVLEYGDLEIADSAALRNKVADTAVGKEVDVVVWRDKKKVRLTVTVGNLEELARRLASIVQERLGAQVGPVTPEETEEYGLPQPGGVSLHRIDPKGPLGMAGFEEGDLILGIDQQPVPDAETFAGMINSLPHNRKVAFLALDHRTGKIGTAVVKIH